MSIAKKSYTDLTIILDLDNTLIHSIKRRLDKINKGIELKQCAYNTYHRPYLKEFLKFCFSYFSKVLIWTAGRQRYAEEIVSLLPIPTNKSFYQIITRDTFNRIHKDPKTLMSSYVELCGKHTFFVDDTPHNILPHPDVIIIPIAKFSYDTAHIDIELYNKKKEIKSVLKKIVQL